MKIEMTAEQAFLAMFEFLADFYRRTGSDDIGSLLGSLSLMGDGKPMDIAMWDEWMVCVSKATSGVVDANSKILP